VAGFEALLDNEVQGAVNIASGTAVPIRSILLTIAELVDWSAVPIC
jgi:hypothetical protein